MINRVWAAATAVGLVVGGACAADETITLKIRKPTKGDVIKESKTEDVDTTVNISAGGQKQEQKDKAGSKFVYTEEVLEKSDKNIKPTKLKRTYETAEVVKMGETVDVGLKGKTVLIEKGKMNYSFALEGGGELKTEATDLLQKEFNKKNDVDMDEMMLPKKPVKVGDTWTVEPKAVEKMFGDEMAVDKDKASVTGKLLKVYDKDKAKWGVIEYVIELPVLSIKSPMGAVDTADGSKLKMTMTIDGCVDGSAYGGSVTGKMDGDITLKIPGAEVALKMKGDIGSKSEAVKK